MTTEATWIPGRMASHAAHIGIGVCNRCFVSSPIGAHWHIAPFKGWPSCVFAKSHRFGELRELAIFGMARRDGVLDLRDLPGEISFDHGVLNNHLPTFVIGPFLKTTFAKRRAQSFEIVAIRFRSSRPR